MSVLKNGRAKAVRFSTLTAICRELGCRPGDILDYVPTRGPTDHARAVPPGSQVSMQNALGGDHRGRAWSCKESSLFLRRPQWSWRESNPRPSALIQDFSGCSPRWSFSQSRRSHGHVADRLSHKNVPVSPCGQDSPASLLDEARI